MKLDKKTIFTIPNILSFFRIVLAVLLLWIFYNPGIERTLFDCDYSDFRTY